MDWDEPALPERKYRVGAEEMTVVVRLGFPRPTEHEDEWACSFQLHGCGNSQVHTAFGVDGLQAITIAASAIRQRLDDAGNVSSSESPYEFVFPRYVPFAHGLDYHRHLCKILDEEVEKKEQEIAAKRIRREREQQKPDE